MTLNVREKLIKTRGILMRNEPFWGYLIYNLTLVENKDCESIGVNFKNMAYNPSWVDKLSEEELKGVLKHEICHIANKHIPRVKSRDHKLWNICCDLCINSILKTAGTILPKSPLVPDNNDSVKLKIGKTTIKIEKIGEKSPEQIYALLDKIKEGDGEGGEGEWENPSDDEMKDDLKQALKEYQKSGKSQDEINKLQDEWDRKITEALVVAKDRGKLPADVERHFGELIKPKINWKQFVHNHIKSAIPTDYTYRRPHRKSLAVGAYLPDVKREKTEVLASIDSSGSMSMESFSEIRSELIHMARTIQHLSIELIICDAEIKGVYKIENGHINKINKLEIRGGGGTSHIPVYEWVKKNRPNAKLLINFTDGYTEFPSKDLNKIIPTLWVITEGGIKAKDVPFGKAINLD